MQKVVINFHQGTFNLEEKPDGLEIVIKEYFDHPEEFDGLEILKDEDGDSYTETIL